MAQNQTGPDSQGNDPTSVGVPIGGFIAFAPYAADNVIADADLGKSPLSLPTRSSASSRRTERPRRGSRRATQSSSGRRVTAFPVRASAASRPTSRRTTTP